jgi:hypothetical protein
MSAVEAAGVLDDPTGKRDGRGEKERIEAREIEAFAEEGGGGEEGKRGGVKGGEIGETLEVGEDVGAFAAGGGAVDAVEGGRWVRWRRWGGGAREERTGFDGEGRQTAMSVVRLGRV